MASNATGMANIPYDLLDMLTGRHTPDNGSYMKFSADESRRFHGFQGNELTVERLDGEDRNNKGS